MLRVCGVGVAMREKPERPQQIIGDGGCTTFGDMLFPACVAVAIGSFIAILVSWGGG